MKPYWLGLVSSVADRPFALATAVQRHGYGAANHKNESGRHHPGTVEAGLCQLT